MKPSLTWLIGQQEWPIVERRLNAVLDEAPFAQNDPADVMEDRKAAMLFTFAISSQAPPEVLKLFLKCNPTLLQRNITPIRIAIATNASVKTMMILEEARSPQRPESPPSVFGV
jgi:hypothetical protein